jgi:hypothetical protein
MVARNMNGKIMTELIEERLYGLIEIAERQQNVVQTALEGMEQERNALREELQRFGENLGTLEEDVRQMASNAILESREGVEQAGASMALEAVEALQNILDDVTAHAEQVAATLRAVTQWLRWRFLWLGLAGAAGLVILWWLASATVAWWDIAAIGRAQAQKITLQAEVAMLEANRDAWVAAGLQGKLRRCGPKNRPCVRVDEVAGPFGNDGDYRLIR